MRLLGIPYNLLHLGGAIVIANSLVIYLWFFWIGRVFVCSFFFGWWGLSHPQPLGWLTLSFFLFLFFFFFNLSFVSYKKMAWRILLQGNWWWGGTLNCKGSKAYVYARETLHFFKSWTPIKHIHAPTHTRHMKKVYFFNIL